MALLKSINVPLGTKAVGFCLKGIDGKMHSLADYDAKEVLVIIIMCNHCLTFMRWMTDLFNYRINL